MAEVHNQQCDSQATAPGMMRYAFSGLAPDQYEHIPAIGEHYVMTVTVQCVGHLEKATANEGIRRSAQLKVVNAVLGKKVAAPDQDPNQASIEDYDDDGNSRPEFGDYDESEGDYRPDEPDGDWAPPADQVVASEPGEGRAPDTVRQLFSDGTA